MLVKRLARRGDHEIPRLRRLSVLETAERRRSQHTVERMPLRPSFEVVEGAGLDARVREGVSPAFLLRVRVVLIAVAIFIVLGLARVALYSATVSSLTANEDLRTQIASAQATKSDIFR